MSHYHSIKLELYLGALDRGFETDKSEALELPDKLTIEHVMPQKWRANWPLIVEKPGDALEEQEKSVTRNEMIHLEVWVSMEGRL